MNTNNTWHFFPLIIILILLISITGIAEPSLSWIKIEVNQQDIFVDRWLREKLSGDWTGAEQFIHDVAIVYNTKYFLNDIQDIEKVI